jgi:tetratricopeptide (TPR) repeat protein
MMARRFALPLSIAAFSLSGCSTHIPMLIDFRGTGSAQAAAEEHQRFAANYEAQGQWADALREWRIAHALEPSAQRPVEQAQRLEAQIAKSAQRHYRAAAAAKAAGNARAARLAALRALALKPDHAKAMDLLRSLESNAVRTRLAAAPKTSKRPLEPYSLESGDPDGRVAPVPTVTLRAAYPEKSTRGQVPGTVKTGRGEPTNLRLGLDALSRDELRKALGYFRAAKQRQEASQDVLEKHLKETRRALADRHYSAGVAKFRASRYGDAAVEFKRALEYDPGHSKAKLYLSSATKLQE